MPFDLVYTSPPFGRSVLQERAPAAFRHCWLAHVASTIEALEPSHVLIESSGLKWAVRRRWPAIVTGQVTVCERDEPYPEVMVFGSPDGFARVTHETPEGVASFDVSEAFAELRLMDRVGHMLHHGALRYLCYEKKAAAKLARCFIEALAEAGGLTHESVPPLKPVSINSADGGQDGLFRLAGRPIWLQVTGGEKPGPLPSAKWPGFAAAHFFLAEGMSSSVFKTRSSSRRRAIYGDATLERADILHVAVGKSAPLASVQSAIRGIAREASRSDGQAPLRLRTVTLHPIVCDLFAGGGSFGGI